MENKEKKRVYVHTCQYSHNLEDNYLKYGIFLYHSFPKGLLVLRDGVPNWKICGMTQYLGAFWQALHTVLVVLKFKNHLYSKKVVEVQQDDSVSNGACRQGWSSECQNQWVTGENPILKVVLWPPACMRARARAHTHSINIKMSSKHIYFKTREKGGNQ